MCFHRQALGLPSGRPRAFLFGRRAASGALRLRRGRLFNQHPLFRARGRTPSPPREVLRNEKRDFYPHDRRRLRAAPAGRLRGPVRARMAAAAAATGRDPFGARHRPARRAPSAARPSRSASVRARRLGSRPRPTTTAPTASSASRRASTSSRPEARASRRAPRRPSRCRATPAATLDLRLEVAGVSTEVVVTASDTPQTVDEVSKAVTTVTAAEMEERDEATVAGASAHRAGSARATARRPRLARLGQDARASEPGHLRPHRRPALPRPRGGAGRRDELPLRLPGDGDVAASKSCAAPAPRSTGRTP